MSDLEGIIENWERTGIKPPLNQMLEYAQQVYIAIEEHLIEYIDGKWELALDENNNIPLIRKIREEMLQKYRVEFQEQHPGGIIEKDSFEIQGRRGPYLEEFDRVINIYKIIITNYDDISGPDLENIYLTMADATTFNERKAINYAREAYRNYTGTAEIDIRYGDILSRTDLLDVAEEFYQKAVDKSNNDPEILIKLAQFYRHHREGNKHREALECFQKINNIEPTAYTLEAEGGLLSTIGRTENSRDKVQQSNQILLKAYKLLGKEEGNYILMDFADNFMFLGKYQYALDIYEEELKEKPEAIRIRFDAGQCHRYLKNYELAISYMEEYIQYHKKELDIFKAENKEENTRFWKPTVDAHEGEIARGHAEIARAHLGKRDFEKAKYHAKLASDINPNNLDAIHVTGRVLMHRGKYQEAEQEFKKINQLNKSSSFYNEDMSELYLAQGQTKDAIKQSIIALIKEKYFNEFAFNQFKDSFEQNTKNKKTLKQTLNEIEQALKEIKNYDKTGIVLTAFFQYVGNGLRDKNLGEKITQLMLKDPSLREVENGAYSKIGKSRNAVKTTHLEWNSDLENDNYVIKINDLSKNTLSIDQLRREYITQLFLSTHLENFNKEKDLDFSLEVEAPVVFLQDEKNAILVQRRWSGNNIKEFMNNANKDKVVESVRKTLYNAAKITSIATQNITYSSGKTIIEIVDAQNNKYTTEVKKFRYIENLQRRFLSRLNIPREERLKFIEAYRKDIDINRNESLNYFIHGDLNTCNARPNGQVFDFEMMARGNPIYDYAHMTTNLDLTNFSENNKQLWYWEYLNSLYYHGVNKDDLTVMLNTLEDNLLHVRLCKIGSNINQGDYERARMYKEIVVQQLENMNKIKLIDRLNSTLKGTLD